MKLNAPNSAQYPRAVIIGLVIALLLLDGALFYITTIQSKESRLAAAEKTLQAAVIGLIEQLDTEFDVFSRTLTGIGEVIAAQNGNVKFDELALHRLLLRRNAITPNWRAIIFLRPDGALAAHSINFPVTSVDFSDREYFQAQIRSFDQGLYIGHPVASRFDQTEVMPLSIRAMSDGGLLLGVVAASVRRTRLAEILALLDLPPDFSLKLLLLDGTPLACFPSDAACTQSNLREAALFKQHLALNSAGSSRQMSLFGEPAGLAAYKRSAQFPIVVTGLASTSAVLQDWRQNLLGYFLIGLASNVALILLGIYAISQYRARQQNLNKLHEANRTLESRVLERTEALRRSEHQTHQIFAGSPVGMLLVDDEGFLIKANAQAATLFGCKEEALIGRIIEDFVPPELRVQHEKHRMAYWHQPHTGMMSERREFTMLKCDGSVLPVEIGFGFVEIEDMKYVVLAISDITERKQAQLAVDHYRNHLEELVRERTLELAQARDDAESASRMKTAILSNMSHELRTPMHQIIGLAQMAQRKATDERQQKSLAHLLEASARLMQLIEKLLSLAQLESGRLKIEAQSFDPRALLQAVLERVQIVATNKGLQLLVEPDANLPTLLRGDAQRISEVLDYLVDNAVKFSASGTISIRAQLLEPQTTLRKVRFEVRDQGIGIRAEDQAQLFESFSQVDDSHRRQFGGAGLGLALSKRLVDLMDGQLGVESTPGSGSTFWVVLSFPHSESALS